MSVGPTISNANTISNRMETQRDFQSRVSNPYASKYGSTPATLKGSSSQAGPASSVSGNTIPSSSVLPSKAATSLAASNRSMGLSGVGGASTAMIGGGIPGGQGSSRSGSGSSGSGGSSSRSGSSGGGGGGGRSSVVTAPGNVSVVPSSVAASQASSNRTMGLPGLTTQQPFITTTGTGTSLISQQKDIIQGTNINDYSNMNLKNTNVNYAGRGVAGPVGYGGTTSPTLPMWSPGSNQNANVYNVQAQGLGTSNIPSSSLAPVTTYPVVKDVTYTVGDLNKMAKDMESERKALEREAKQIATTSPYSPEMMQQAENARTLTRITAEYNNKLDKTEADQKAFFASVEKLGYNVVPVKEKNVITGYTFESPQVATASNKAQVDAYMAKANAFNEKANFLNAAGKVMSYVEPVVYTPKTGWAKAEQTVSIKAFGVAGTKNEGILPGKPYLPNEAYPGTGRISQVARGIYRTGTEKPLTVAAIGVGGFVAGAAVPVVAASFTGIAGTTAAGTAITYGALGTKLAGGAALGFGLGASGASVALSDKPWEALGEQITYWGVGGLGASAGSLAGRSFVTSRLTPQLKGTYYEGIATQHEGGRVEGGGRLEVKYGQRLTPFGKSNIVSEKYGITQVSGYTSKSGSRVFDTFLQGKDSYGFMKSIQEPSGVSTSYLELFPKGKSPVQFTLQSDIRMASPKPEFVSTGNQFFTGTTELMPVKGRGAWFEEVGSMKNILSDYNANLDRFIIASESKSFVPVVVRDSFRVPSFKLGKGGSIPGAVPFSGGKDVGWNFDNYVGRTGVDVGPKVNSFGGVSSFGNQVSIPKGKVSTELFFSPGAVGKSIVISKGVTSVPGVLFGPYVPSSVPVGVGSVSSVRYDVKPVVVSTPMSISSSLSVPSVVPKVGVLSVSGVESTTASGTATATGTSSVTEVTNITNIVPIAAMPAVPIVPFGFGLPNLPGVPKEYRPKVSIPLRKKRKGGSPSLLQFTKGLVPTGGLKVNVTGFEAVRGTGIKRMNMGSVLKGTAPRVNPFAKLMRKPNKSKLKFDLRMAA